MPLLGAAPFAEPLYALIDDEEESEPLYAIIDDEDQGRDQAARSPVPPARPAPYSLADMNLAELAPLDDQDDPQPASAAAAGFLTPPDPTPARGPSGPTGNGRKALQVFDESGDHVPLLRAFGASSSEHETVLRSARGPSLRPWILGGVGAGACVVLLVIAVSLLSSSNPSSTTDVVEQAGPVEGTEVVRGQGPLRNAAHPVSKTAKAIVPVKSSSGSGPEASKSQTALEPLPRDVAEPTYPPELESKLVPAWASGEIPARVEGPFVTVQRVVEAIDNAHAAALWRAFEKIGGTIELADNGPFFEDDFQIAGKDRLIRAKPGFRPIVKVEPPTTDFVRAQPAVFVLDGSRLILDGIDLVVNVQELPKNQSALFLCRGAELTVHNCTITVINPNSQPFALVQTDDSPGAEAQSGASASSRFSKIRVENTLVRAQAATGFDLTGGSADVALVRSVLLSGAGTLFSLSGGSNSEPTGPRRIYLVRSVVATSGSVFSVAGTASGGGMLSPVIRAIGTTFARVSGDDSACLIGMRGEGSSSPRERLDWHGDYNTYAGWPAWLSSGTARGVRFSNLGAARLAWSGSDGSSKESTAVWPEAANLAWKTCAELRTLAPDRLAVLTRVAAPGPHLREKTIGAFERLALPTSLPAQPAPFSGERTSSSAGSPGGSTSGPGSNGRDRVRDSRPMPTARVPGLAPPPEPPPPAEPGVIDLPFDALAAPWHGDLGRFLNDQLKGDLKKARVLAHGSGTHMMTPVHLPEGVSLEILVDFPSFARNDPLTWEAHAGSTGEALIDARAADVRMVGVRLKRAAGSSVKHLIRVEDGHLLLSQCWLSSASSTGAEAGAGPPGSAALIAIEARSALSPSAKSGDRPVCRLMDCLLLASGDAIVAEVGRGIVALDNCAVSSGGDAFVLSPLVVPRGRFEADLWLDHCTIAAEHNFVRLARWPSSSGPPDRPWLVSSVYTALVAAFGHGKDTVLLRPDPAAIAQGVLFWQGEGDADEVVHFTASGNAPPLPNPRPDVRREWVELWGLNHMTRITGPALNGPKVAVRFVGDQLRSGKVAPADLALNPTYHPGRSYLDVGADLRRIGVAVPNSTR
jgi:serine/threonine-protein kinase